jgi:hypothetical protein
VEVVEEKFLDDACFPGIGKIALRRSDGWHPDLAAGIAAQYRTVLHQGGFDSHSGGCHGGTYTGKSSADDHKLMMMFSRSHEWS